MAGLVGRILFRNHAEHSCGLTRPILGQMVDFKCWFLSYDRRRGNAIGLKAFKA